MAQDCALGESEGRPGGDGAGLCSVTFWPNRMYVVELTSKKEVGPVSPSSTTSYRDREEEEEV